MTQTTAILIRANGEITTPHFPGPDKSDTQPERSWIVRQLTGSHAPFGLEIPDLPGLVFWTDGLAGVRMLGPNMIGTAFLTEVALLPLHIVCGPLLLTGGSYTHPHGLAPVQTDGLSAVLDLDLWEPIGDV